MVVEVEVNGFHIFVVAAVVLDTLGKKINDRV